MVEQREYAPAVDFLDFLEEGEEEYNWLIPDLLEYGDRLIVTGREGRGKSTFLRQFAIQVAAGKFPFGEGETPRRRVLLIDLENPRTLARRKFRTLADGMGLEVERGWLTMLFWPQGIDLVRENSIDKELLRAHIRRIEPELVIVGPMYKMSADDLRDEDASAKLARSLDELRAQFNFALLMESHQPHEVITANEHYRPERPYGSSLWMRWPEFGMCIEDNGTLRPWRGARDERDWPGKLRFDKDLEGWVMDQRLCQRCDRPLERQQDKYCSEACRHAANQAAYRQRGRRA